MSGIIEIKYNRRLAAGAVFSSDVVSAGGHDWKVTCFPDDEDEFVSVYLELMSEAKNVTAVFDAAVFIDSGDLMRRRTVHVYNLPRLDGDFRFWGFPRFLHMGNRCYSHARILWAVVVVDNDGSGEPESIYSVADVPEPRWPMMKGTIAVPPSDMADKLGRMLDSASLTDVSFVVDNGQGQTLAVRAHRALLAARSPVFEAALCGHMLEANAPRAPIMVLGMDPDTFTAMLRFIYTDNLPTGVDNDEAIRSLLAAADRYALDRLKLLCAKRLLGNVSVSTVTGMLDCAETYNCPELKTKCIDYLMVDPNIYMDVSLTDDFMELVARSPSLVAEMRKRRSEHKLDIGS
ncbi:unnamed protein product [Alopecurus aequalis]